MNILDPELLGKLGLIVMAAAAFAFIGRAIRMPSIVVYIIAGLVLGPFTGILEVDDAIDLISHIGIALLLFLVGLELSLDKIKDVGRVAVAAGIGQVVFTAAGGLILCLLLGFEWIESVFISVALTFSSTVVVVKLLDLKGDLNKLYGRIAVGIFLVQDLVVVVVLTFLAGLEHGEGNLNLSQVAWGMTKAFIGMGLILGFALVSSKYLLPRPFCWAARSPETTFIWALFWCFLFVLLAEVLGLSHEIGAFLAGMALAQLPYNDDLRRRLHPLMNFFIAVFFVSLGITMELEAATQAWPIAIALSLFVLIGNPLIFMIIIARMKYSELTAFRTSVTVAQISEFSFVFATAGVAANLIGNQILSIIALVGVITITTSAYMILYSDPLYRFMSKLGLLRIFRAGKTPEPEEEHSLQDHVVVVGMNPLGRSIVEKLHSKGVHVLAIDTDPNKLEGLPCETEVGNVEYESVVEELGLRRAKLVVSALQIEDTNHLLAYRCRMANVPCAIHAFDVSVVEDLVDLETEYLMVPSVDGVIRQRELLIQKNVTEK